MSVLLCVESSPRLVFHAIHSSIRRKRRFMVKTKWFWDDSQKRLIMQPFLAVLYRIHQCDVPCVVATKPLQRGYKMLVQWLQTPCSVATRCLYCGYSGACSGPSASVRSTSWQQLRHGSKAVVFQRQFFVTIICFCPRFYMLHITGVWHMPDTDIASGIRAYALFLNTTFRDKMCRFCAKFLRNGERLRPLPRSGWSVCRAGLRAFTCYPVQYWWE